MGAKGSLHEYLYHLHDKGHCPVTSFWWGKEHVVSVCSPQAFKDTIKLTDRAGEGEKGGGGGGEGGETREGKGERVELTS